jgi:dihydroxyacetone kinase-like protein
VTAVTEVVDAARIDAWLREFAELIIANEEMITKLDSVVGDGDHGENLRRGMNAVLLMLDADDRPSLPGPLLKLVGRRLVSTVGGTSGALYGTFFLRMGGAAGEAETLSPQLLGDCFVAGASGLVARGKAEVGDKTMYDSVQPAAKALSESVAEGATLHNALKAAEQAACQGRDATASMVARKGRASYLGDRSLGHADAGATSAALLFEAAVRALG